MEILIIYTIVLRIHNVFLQSFSQKLKLFLYIFELALHSILILLRKLAHQLELSAEGIFTLEITIILSYSFSDSKINKILLLLFFFSLLFDENTVTSCALPLVAAKNIQRNLRFGEQST